METENKAQELTLAQEETQLYNALFDSKGNENGSLREEKIEETPTAPESKEKEAPAKAEGEKESVKESESKSEVKSEEKQPEEKLDDLSDISDDRLKKDAERLAKSWKKHTEEKTEFRKKESEYQAKLSDYETKLKQLEDSQVNSKYSPEQLRGWAKKWDDEGEIEKAKAARQEANELEDKQIRLRTERARQKEEFATTWKATEKILYTEYPELAKEGSELRDKTADLLSRNDDVSAFIHSKANGLKMAVRLADLMIKADLASDLQKENADLKAKLIDREKKLTPSGSVPGREKGKKSFEEMDLKEQEAHLMSQLEAA